MANGVGATMTAHFAKRGNLADVSAKSASLGTVAQLIGTIVRYSHKKVWELIFGRLERYCYNELHLLNQLGLL